MKTLRGATLILMAALVFAGCSKTAGIEGKVTDGKGQPMSGVKMIAQQVQPIKGYEHFEVMTGTDGAVKFVGLFPSADYVVSPRSDIWTPTSRTQLIIKSGPEGHTAMFDKPFKIGTIKIKSSGMIVDTRTGRQWTEAEWDAMIAEEILRLLRHPEGGTGSTTKTAPQGWRGDNGIPLVLLIA